MRAFYSTQKHFRAFILGTPEGWQVSVYDLQRHEWVEKAGRIENTLKNGQGDGSRKDFVVARQNNHPGVEVALMRRTGRRCCFGSWRDHPSSALSRITQFSLVQSAAPQSMHESSAKGSDAETAFGVSP